MFVNQISIRVSIYQLYDVIVHHPIELNHSKSSFVGYKIPEKSVLEAKYPETGYKILFTKLFL